METVQQKVKRLHDALDNENISYGEIVEIDDLARSMGIEVNDDKMAVDILIEIEGKLA